MVCVRPYAIIHVRSQVKLTVSRAVTATAWSIRFFSIFCLTYLTLVCEAGLEVKESEYEERVLNMWLPCL